MNKIFLTVILFVITIVSPMFAAEKGKIELVGKLGAAVNTKMSFIYEENGSFKSDKLNPAISIAAEGLYYLLSELPLGLGVNYRFSSEVKNFKNSETGATNIYLTVRPTLKTDSKIFTSVYVTGQIGYGLNRMDGNAWDVPGEYKEEVDSNGLYWGLGIGTEIINDFIFEFVFSTNYWKEKYQYYHSSKPDITNMETTAITFFAGYKFNI